MTHTHAPRAAYVSRVIVNRFPGTCNLCRNRVEAEKGVAMKDDAGGKWITQHNADECPPPAAPRAPLPQPALGYYVRTDGAGIKVVESKTNPGRRYGLIFTPHPPKRPTWDYVRGAGLSVAELTPMTPGDAAQLGLAHGHCIFCCAPLGGETLSSHVSALIGYGETCARKQGLPYPQGVKAQRAFVNAAE